jgi:hypothetical protein
MGKLKRLSRGSEGKPSLNRAISISKGVDYSP